MNDYENNDHPDEKGMIPYQDVEKRVIVIRDQRVLLDCDVALLYGVQTKRVNEAVRNNPAKFPKGYVFELSEEESSVLRSNFSTLEQSEGKGRYSKYRFKAFTERGLYMIATVLKSPRATAATIAIIETFAKVRSLKRELVDLHKETDKEKQVAKMKHFGDVLTDIVMPDLEVAETESSLELNFIIGKIKHTVKRVKKETSKE